MSADRSPVPAGAEGDEALMSDWAAELAERLQAGEPVDPDALAGSDPARAEQLRRMLPTIRRLALFGRAVACDSGPAGPADRDGPGLGTLGDFHLLREVGRGGMGIVYEAEQVSLRRRVALKILPLAGALDPRHHQRFLLEARAAACLHHPNIVPVYAVGSERGVPYYAMQFIDGSTLAEVLRDLVGEPRSGRGSMTWPAEATPTPAPAPSTVRTASSSSSHRDRAYIRTVARHGRSAAEALDHAHGRGILHRDIKPANLMIDGEGHLWITDFGLAQIQGDSRLTLTGDLVGTLRYMSPEQALARRVVVDGRTDIYSLGATLYELLALRPVFDGGDRTEILRKIAQDEPTPLRRLNPAVPADLETIIHKTLAKEPADRYATARELADDLGRFLDARPIAARPPGRLERLGRWAGRNRAVAVPAAVFGVAAVIALGGGLAWSNHWLRGHSGRLRVERDRAAGLARELQVQRDLAEQRRRIADRHLHAFRLRRAGEALRAGRIEKAQEMLRDGRPLPGEADLREFAWHHLWRESRREVAVLSGRDEQVHTLALSVDGRTLATGDRDGTIRLRDAANGDLLRAFRGHDVPIGALAFAPDGRRLASGTNFERFGETPSRGELIVWDVATGRPLARPEDCDRRIFGTVRFDPTGEYFWERSIVPGPLTEVGVWRLIPEGNALRPRLVGRWAGGPNLALSADGRRAVVIEADGPAAVVEVPGGRVLSRLPPAPHTYHGLALSEDGRRAAAVWGIPDGGPVETGVWEVETGRRLFERREGQTVGPVDPLAFGPDGRSLLAVYGEGVLVHHDLDSGRTWSIGADPVDGGHSNGDLSRLAGGRLLAWSYRGDHTGPRPMRVLDADGGAVRATFPGRTDFSHTAAALPDGHSLVFVSGVRAVRWDFEPAADPQPAGHGDEAWTAAFAGDGRRLATGGDDDDPLTVRVWEPATGRLVRGWKAHDGTTAAVAFQPGGPLMATAGLCSEGNLRLWDAATGAPVATLDGHTNKVRSVAFRPDGRLLASAGSDHTVRLWDVADRRLVRSLAGHTDAVRQVAFSPDGRVLASVGNDATVRLWDADRGEPSWAWEGDVKVAAVAFAPDGRTLAWAQEDGIIQRLELAGLRLLPPLHSEDDELRCLAFAPDGRTLAAGGTSGAVHLWDPAVGQGLLSLDGRPCQVNALAFAPDGRSLAVCWHDGTVRLVRAR